MILGLLVLFVTLIAVSIALVIATLGAMYLVQKKMADLVPDPKFLELDFENFQTPAFKEVMTQVAIIVLAPTLVFHLVEYFIFDITIRRHPFLICLVLTLLETISLYVGFHFSLKLDAKRAGILTAANFIVYVFLLWAFLYYILSS